MLAQFRAIESGLERITIKVLEKTYQEDLKPIHSMIQALQSGKTNRIAEYSDLVIPDIDRKILNLQERITQKFTEVDDEAIYQGHEPSIRLHRLLKDVGYDSGLLPNVVIKIFNDFPAIILTKALPIAMQLLSEEGDNLPIKSNNSDKTVKSGKAKSTPTKKWHTLDTDDLRFQFSQKIDDESCYTHLKANTSIIFDFEAFLKAG